MSSDTSFPVTLEVSEIAPLALGSYFGFMGGKWEKGLAPVIGNAIHFLLKFPEFIFQKQVSMTPYIFYQNSLFVQKKDEIGAFYKQGSGVTHLCRKTQRRTTPKSDVPWTVPNIHPLCKAKPLAPLSCRSARSMGDPPGGEGEAPRHCPGSRSLPA